MASPSKYSPEFRTDAVALWRASAGRRTFKSVADDLNINHETLRTWVREAEGAVSSVGGPQAGGVEDEPARLRAENARLVKAEKEWQLEREILRRAAAFRAGDEATPRRWDFISRQRRGFRRAAAVPGTWCLPIGLLPLAGWRPDPCRAPGGRGRPDRGDPRDLRRTQGDLRRTADPRRAAGLRPHREPQARGTADAQAPHRRPPSSPQEDHHGSRSARAASPGPGPARLHRHRPRRTLVRRHHVHPGRCVVALPRLRDRHLLTPVLGWSMAPNMRAGLVIDALRAETSPAGAWSSRKVLSSRPARRMSSKVPPLRGQLGERRIATRWSQIRSRSQCWETPVRSMGIERPEFRPKCSVRMYPSSRVSVGVT